MGASSYESNNLGSIWKGKYLPITLANLTVVAVAAFDGLAIVAALPNIAKDLGNVSLSPWVLTAYLATSAVAAIVAGPIIDTIGVRRTFQITGLWFLFTSALAAVAPSMTLLIAARSLQGIGGGLLIAVALASVGLAYPENLRPTAFAANSMVWGTLGLGGPVIAGALLELSGWRLIFVVQLPITAIAIGMGWRRLPDVVNKEEGKGLNFDLRGISLLSICIIASLVAVSELTKSPILAVILFVTTGLFTYLYWYHSGQDRDPVLLRRHIIKFPLNRIHIASALALITGLATDNYLPLYMQTTRGRSEAFASFSVVFLTVGWTSAAFATSKILNRKNEEDVILLGSILMIPSVLLAGISVSFSYDLKILFAAYFLIGASIGFISTSGLTLLQSSSTPEEMGRTNSAHQFLRTLAITYGVAIGGAIILSVVEARTGDVESVRKVLSGDNVTVASDTIEAIGSGLAWAHVFSGSTACIGLFVAVSLYRKKKALQVNQ